MKLWGCDIMELSHDHHPLENIAVDKRMRVRVLTKNEARKELDEIINELEGSIQVVFRDASCSACGVTNDRRLMPDFCHFHPEQIHPGEMQPFHPEPLAPYHPQGVEKRGHRQARTGPHRKNPKHTAIGGWVGRQLTPDWAYYYPCCDRSHRSGHKLNLFTFPFSENSLICLEGKSMTPHGGKSVLFRSSQQLPRLRLGPSKGFLS